MAVIAPLVEQAVRWLPDRSRAPLLVAELKEEREARDELKTGNKAWLRRRLHGAIVRVHLEATATE